MDADALNKAEPENEQQLQKQTTLKTWKKEKERTAVSV